MLEWLSGLSRKFLGAYAPSLPDFPGECNGKSRKPFALFGQNSTAGRAVLAESHPRSSWRSSAEFRLALLEELTAQALKEAVKTAKEA